ncbi:uncharacterized protein LOC135477223 [Liolophura sinensis]|uniref:uncharacterized protein LOC135477223 n=1 Tax=Liolophura sinensis TaxID=3198878 RepID=UPI003158F9C5
MLLHLIFILAAVCLSQGEKLCLSDEVCGNGCEPSGLHIGKCLQQRCFCVALPGKRGTNNYILEGECSSAFECHERCAPTGMFFGRCLGDRCSCYTLMGKRFVRPNTCLTSADCEKLQQCRGEFQYSDLCIDGVCGCGFAQTG